MANTITIRGFATTGIELRTTPAGLVVGDFRMGSNERRPDPITNVWADGPTNWFRVSAFRALAQNAAASIHKGDRIIVVGKLKINTFLRKDGTPGTNVEIVAETIGPDLLFGTAHYIRVASAHPVGRDYSGTDADPSAAGRFTSGGGAEVVHFHDEDPGPDNATHDGDDQGEGSEDTEDPAALADDQEATEDGEVVNTSTGELIKEDVPF
ncbi:single-stranded DNA-binding protein [Arthrobacter glacialis]|uniref:single-stranded DNA-binding protein n=1 Tax=Arthrobacter glacialis TaxID=1664 RepID=UPI000CD3FB46|nr:single-stranded DNA-binding protein [Arthrobacter glacialis]POH58885.1 single-stranded DNA-binding protein [Arthrobacter glacialis]